MPISRSTNKMVEQTDTGGGQANLPNVPDPYGGEGVVTQPVPATYQAPAPTPTQTQVASAAPNVPDPYGGEGVVSQPTPAQYSNIASKERLEGFQRELNPYTATPKEEQPAVPDPYGVNAWDQQRDAAAAPISGGGGTAGTGAPGGGGTGGGGGVVTGGGAAATGGVTTGEPGAGGEGGETDYAAAANAILTQIGTTEFSWNPDTDMNYQIGVKQAEQAVVGMMVGRGGLWSSVTSNAFASKVFELQAQYYNVAWEKYVDNRNFQLQMAQVLYGRDDEMWSRQMEVLKYKADREDAANALAMQNQQMALQWSKFEYEKQYAQDQLEIARNQSLIAVNVARYQSLSSDYTRLKADWEKAGKASGEVASFFGVPDGTPYTGWTGMSKRRDKEVMLTELNMQIEADATAWGDYETLVNQVNDWYTETSTSSTKAATVDVYGKDTTLLGTVEQENAYLDARSAMLKITNSDTLNTFRRNLNTDNSRLIQSMGTNYLKRLRYEVDQRLEQLTSVSRIEDEQFAADYMGSGRSLD